MRDPIPVYAHLRRATDLIDRGFAEPLLTWITIFPLITAITGRLLVGLPLAVRPGITTALTVLLMTWVVMPRVTRLLRGWLYPDYRPVEASASGQPTGSARRARYRGP